MQTHLRRETEWRGKILPAHAIIDTQEMETAQALMKEGLASPANVQIFNLHVKAGQPETVLPDRTVNYPDVFIVGRTVDGKGGGERSLKRIAELLRLEGYSVILGDPEYLNKQVSAARIYPKMIIVQCCFCTEEYIKQLRGRFEDSKIVQYVQFLGKMDTHWGSYHSVLYNSEFSRDKGIELGCARSKCFVQFPPLDSWAKVFNVTRKYIMCTNMSEAKGGDIVRELAKLFPKQKFFVLDNKVTEVTTDGNVTTSPWVMDMRPVYAETAALLYLTKYEETYGRAIAEALGNGIPAVTTDVGNFPWFKERAPNLVHVVPLGSPIEVYADALKAALKTRKRDLKPWKEAFEMGIEGTKDLLAAHKIAPGEQRECKCLYFGGGLGDVIMQLPILKDLARDCDLYVDNRCSDHVKAILDLCPFLRSGVTPGHSEYINVSPYNNEESAWIWTSEQRQESIARRYKARLDSPQPVIGVSRDMMELASYILPKRNGRKRIGLGLVASVAPKTVKPGAQKDIADALVAAGYQVIVLHSQQTLGSSEFITDLGGKVTVSEMLHCIALLDCMIAVDSGIAHMAAMMHTPLVALMGPVGQGKHIQFEKGYPATRIIELCKNLDCQPCWFHSAYKCKDYGKCLEFSGEVIVEAVRKVLP